MQLPEDTIVGFEYFYFTYFVLCWILQPAAQISTDNVGCAVLRAHTTALGHASQLPALQPMKGATQIMLFGEKKPQQVDTWKDTYEKTIQCQDLICKPLNLSI